MNNLKYYRKSKGLNQEDVAKLLGISTTAYGHYETGRRNPPADNLAKLADIYDVSVDILMGRVADSHQTEITDSAEPVTEDDVFVPLVASLRCGYGENGNSFAFIKKVPIPASYVRRWGDGLKCVMAIGDSMSSTIVPGDKLLCRPGDAWESGNIVVININDSDTVKRIYRTSDGGIDLKPDNPNFQTVHYSPKDIENLQIHVLGRVLISISKEL